MGGGILGGEDILLLAPEGGGGGGAAHVEGVGGAAVEADPWGLRGVVGWSCKERGGA